MQRTTFVFQLKGCFPNPQPLRLKMEIFCQKKDCSYFWGILRALYLHFNCPPNLTCHCSFNKWWSKGKPTGFCGHPCNSPSPGNTLNNWPSWLFYLILKFMCMWGQGICAHKCKCPQRSSWLFKMFYSIYLLIYSFILTCEQHMEVRGQLAEAGSLLPPCGSQESNSGQRKAPSPAEPSCWSPPGYF